MGSLFIGATELWIARRALMYFLYCSTLHRVQARTWEASERLLSPEISCLDSGEASSG